MFLANHRHVQSRHACRNKATIGADAHHTTLIVFLAGYGLLAVRNTEARGSGSGIM